jgi:signal transduction histidine kinase
MSRGPDHPGQAGKSLRALLIEDAVADADLLICELEAGGYRVASTRVETSEELVAALRSEWDVVLSDYTLSHFDALSALKIVQAYRPELPFIVVSGAMGEDLAAIAFKAGADDFLVKGRLTRLVPAIERELRDAKEALERKELEEQLRQSQKLESIGRLAGGIAHDFNNLLTAILGYTDMVLEQIGADKPISKDLEEIRTASNRAVVLTRQLLAFSRRQSLHVSPVDLNEVVSTMHSMLQRLIGERIDIALRLSSPLPAILADRGQLEQVLMNLLVNARDAMPQGGNITIETSSADQYESTAAIRMAPGAPGHVRLRVSDDGHGMDEKTQARIFEPFFTTKSVGEGTGLGLSMVYGVMQQLGGQITVNSRVGRGTTFTLYFPQASSDIDALNAAVDERKGVALSEHREVVLVVEDQRGVRQLVTRILSRHGYTVLEACSGIEALDLFEQNKSRIELLVTDIVMPQMGGGELATRLRAMDPSLPVLFMSGYSEEDLGRLTDVGAHAAIIEKPFNASSLLQAVRDVLAERPLPSDRSG